MKRITLGLLAAILMTAPTMAAGYIPIGPKVYTPNAPIVTPQAPTVTPQAPTVTGGGFDNRGGSSEPHIGNPNPTGKGWFNAKCNTIANVNADCVPYSMNPTHGATPIPVVVTANPDLVTPNPDIVTPVADSCSQRGWSPRGGFGYYSC